MKRADAQRLLNPELDRRLGDVGRRLDSAVTRAGIVIAAGLVVMAIPADPTPGRWLPLGFALTTIILAAPAILFRDGHEVPVGGLLENADQHAAESLSAEVFEKKLALLSAEETVMDRRARQLSLSYGALALATASVVLTHAIVF